MRRTMLILMLVALCALPAATPDTLRIAFTGDIMTHDSQIHGARTANGYDFRPVFRHVAPLLRQADLAVGNLETVCAQRPPTGYPRFNAPVELLDALAWAGYDVLSVANNHATDQGSDGLAQTIDAIGQRGMAACGTAGTQPLTLGVNGFTVWMAAYTYGSNVVADGEVAPARIDTSAIHRQLRAASADVRIVCLHWGTEYHRQPSPAQVALADSLLAWGASAVIGSHPHVIQPLRRDKRGLVAFSLGNFVSGQREGNPGVRYTEDGVILQLEFHRDDAGVTLAGVSTEPTWVHRYQRADEGWHYLILPTSLDLKMQYGWLTEKLWQSRQDTESALHPRK